VNGTHRDHRRASPDTAIRYTDLEAVSCATRTFCAAVGYYENDAGTETLPLAEMWNGTRWAVRALHDPNGTLFATLYGVSCPSRSFCEAVGYGGVEDQAPSTVAEVWTGTGWKYQSTPQPANGTEVLFAGVSCTSSTFCEAVGTYAPGPGAGAAFVTLAESWNGTRWALQPTLGLAKYSDRVFTAVSCTSPTFCEAVGVQFGPEGGAYTLANIWNGTKWSRQAVPNPPGDYYNELDGVSCASSSFCEAIGDYPPEQGTFVTLAESWNGTKWALQTVPTPTVSTRSGSFGVSCPSSRFCEAVGWNDTGGVTAPQVTLADSWNGTKWAVQTTPNPTGASPADFYGVSCTSSGFCEAVGNYSSTSGDKTLGEGWNGTKWAIQTTPNP
jgi:hypothetical protein